MVGIVIRSIVALALVVGVVLTVYKKTRYAGKAVISDAVGVTAFFAVIEVFCANIGMGTPWWVLLAGFAAVILPAAIIICAIWGRLKNKAVWISLTAALLLCCAVAIGWQMLYRQGIFPAPSEPGVRNTLSKSAGVLYINKNRVIY